MLLIFVWTIVQKSRLKNNSVVGRAIIYDVTTLNKSSGIFFRYRYKIAELSYDGNQRVTCEEAKRTLLGGLLIHRGMPIVYEKNRPGNSELLLTRKQFQEYGLPISEEYIDVVDSIQAICSRKELALEKGK